MRTIVILILLAVTAPLWFPFAMVGLMSLAVLIKSAVVALAPFVWHVAAATVATLIAFWILDRIRK